MTLLVLTRNADDLQGFSATITNFGETIVNAGNLPCLSRLAQDGFDGGQTFLEGSVRWAQKPNLVTQGPQCHS